MILDIVIMLQQSHTLAKRWAQLTFQNKSVVSKSFSLEVVHSSTKEKEEKAICSTDRAGYDFTCSKWIICVYDLSS